MAPPPLSKLRVVDWTEQDEFYPARGTWQSWVRSDAKLSMTARTVAVEITDRISPDKNGAWPSQLLIAARLGCSDRTVRTAVGELFERGWLAARRGGFEGKGGEAPKTGVRASYTYIMAVDPDVLDDVLAAEAERIASFKLETASIPYRQKIAAMRLASKPEESFRSNRKISSALTGKILPPKPEENCRIISTENLTTEPLHGISEERGLSDATVQDRSQEQLDPDLVALLTELGDGDISAGRERSRIVSSDMFEAAFEAVKRLGVAGCQSHIQFLREAAESGRASA